jgi:hypothetical protein
VPPKTLPLTRFDIKITVRPKEEAAAEAAELNQSIEECYQGQQCQDPRIGIQDFDAAQRRRLRKIRTKER